MILANIARKRLPGWNKKVFTEAYILRRCAVLGVQVRYLATGVPGCYGIYDGSPMILIDPNIHGGVLSWVLLHELSHHLLHTPAAHAFNAATHDKMNWEANFIAAIGLIPLPLARSNTLAEIEEEYGYPARLLWFRKEILESYKF